ncbi:MAG: tail fiber assembly protein [Bilophila wadsworthia]
MKQHVIVVPSDRLIIVDGTPLQFDFPAPEKLHAVQWHEGSGHMEWTDDINHPLTSADYAGDVAPFVALWEAEKARLEEEAAAAEAARLAEYNSEPARAARVRTERDRRLSDCAWIVERHRDQLENGEPTTLTDGQYQAWLGYRQALRDLPQQPGFPWLGGDADDTDCPWPTAPILPSAN